METIDLKLTREEFNLVLTGLMELPAKASINLIARLNKEAEAKNAEAAKKPLEKVK